MIADASSSLGADNDKVVVLAPAERKNIRALIVNPGLTDEEVQLTCGPRMRLDDLEIVDSADNRCCALQKVTVPPGGCLKVVRKS